MDSHTQLNWPREFDEVASDLGWDERRRRYAWRRKLGQSNPEIARAEGYSRWNAQRLRAIVYGDLFDGLSGRSVHNAVEFANEIESRMQAKRER